MHARFTANAAYCVHKWLKESPETFKNKFNFTIWRERVFFSMYDILRLLASLFGDKSAKIIEKVSLEFGFQCLSKCVRHCIFEL